MLTYQRRKKRILLTKAMIALTAMLLALVLLDMQIRPAVKKVAAYQAALYAVQAMNEAIGEELAKGDIDYSALVRVDKGEDGVITAVESDMLGMNQIKVGITEAVAKRMEELEDADLSLPLGSLVGWQIFSGRGPMVDFRILHVGYVQSEITSDFQSAGINQTNHQIILHVTVDITAIVPGYSVDTKASTNVCLAETVIVGHVPEAYTNVEGADGETRSLINDYGADAIRERYEDHLAK